MKTSQWTLSGIWGFSCLGPKSEAGLNKSDENLSCKIKKRRDKGIRCTFSPPKFLLTSNISAFEEMTLLNQWVFLFFFPIYLYMWFYVSFYKKRRKIISGQKVYLATTNWTTAEFSQCAWCSFPRNTDCSWLTSLGYPLWSPWVED